MRISRLCTAIVLLAASGSLAAARTPHDPLPIAEVVELSKSGTPQQQVIQHIRESRTTYQLRGSDFVKLKGAGVPDPVLDFLQQSLVDDLDLLTRYWVLGGNLGGCSFCYPQPVDIDTMRSGYGTVVSPSPLRYSLAKPPGTPEWVPAQLGPARQRLSVEQVAELARTGTPDAQLVEQIRNSRLEHVIGVSGPSTVHTRPIAGLTGSRFVQLHDQGVSDTVLDTLQAQFLAQFIEAERLRYQNWGKGPGSMR